MFGFSSDAEERYDEYVKDGSMFGVGRMDFQEWMQIENQADDIASGLVIGTFQRDEKVWDRVKEIEDHKCTNSF